MASYWVSWLGLKSLGSIPRTPLRAVARKKNYVRGIVNHETIMTELVFMVKSVSWKGGNKRKKMTEASASAGSRCTGYSPTTGVVSDIVMHVACSFIKLLWNKFTAVLDFKFLVWLFTAGGDAAQILEKCQPPGFPESDDDESDYFADDEISLCLSPCHNNASDSENEDHSQISKSMCSICLVIFLHFVLCNVWCWIVWLSHPVKFWCPD